MRLIKISVAAFQCIDTADVELGPGLNVLYGPNDHGKSSLAAAIRAALLLPHTSTAHERFVSWHTGDMPRVTLSFATEQQRFWRVHKVFGKGGHSTLESSKDGRSFSKEMDARQVDDRIRELLRWGIPKPGGSGTVKGLPESFLTTVLLAEQADVPGILERGLSGDKEESGRLRLNEALQALAQDPLFKQVLDRAIEKMGRAYTSGGKLSKSKGSPLQAISAEVAELRKQHYELERKIAETETAEDGLRTLYSQLEALGTHLESRKRELNEARESALVLQAQLGFQAELNVARTNLESFQQEVDALREQAERLDAIDAQLQALEAELQATRLAEEAARAELQEAENRAREASSDDAARERTLRIQQLENQRLQAKQKLSEVQAKVEHARAALKLSEQAELAASDVAKTREQVTPLRAAVSEIELERQVRSDLVRHLKDLNEYAALEDLRRQLADATASAGFATAMLEEARSLRTRTEELKRGLEVAPLPSPAEVTRLQKLAHELEVAEARLGGGLSILVQPKKILDVTVTADGIEQTRTGSASFEVEAQRLLTLQVHDLLDVTITAGEAQVRQEVDNLRQQWLREAIPAMKLAGVDDIASLVKARCSADEVALEAEQALARAADLEQRAAEHTTRAQGIEQLQQRVVEREKTLDPHKSREFADELASLGSSWETVVQRRSIESEAAISQLSTRLEETRSRVDVIQGRMTGEELAYTKLREEAEIALRGYPDGIENVLEASVAELDTLAAQISHTTAQIESVANQAGLEAQEAAKSAEAAKSKLEVLVTKGAGLDTQHNQLRETRAKLSGMHEERSKKFSADELAFAQDKVAALELRFNQLAQPTSTIDLTTAESAVALAQELVQSKQQEIDMAKGALLKVGGQAVREQAEDLVQAIALATDREHHLEVEYQAWKLLAETLREVENTEGAHLGRALSAPVSLRLRQLCGGRYGDLTIDSHLKTEGLQAAGQLRPWSALSEGTKDQLATLFRLGIAEHLGSLIVLDDHLNQSDRTKIEWFLNALRSAGEKIQVLLITCRPDDYLGAAEQPAAEAVVWDGPCGRFRAVNLSGAIRRFPLGVEGGF